MHHHGRAPALMKSVVDQLTNWIAFEPRDEITVEFCRTWLQECYPEAEWSVKVCDGELEIEAHFDSPAEAVFYRLKW
jgi:hypothetical protein